MRLRVGGPWEKIGGAELREVRGGGLLVSHHTFLSLTANRVLILWKAFRTRLPVTEVSGGMLG